MELRHLRYFLMVAEERQMTRAAARLHMQQPPLSQQIQELEQELGFLLFRRLPRGVELTPAGAAFEEHARAIFTTLSRGIENGRRVASGVVGNVRVALTSSAAFHPTASAAVREFRQRFPDVAVELQEISATDTVDALLEGTIDAAMLYGNAPVKQAPSSVEGSWPIVLQTDLLHDETMVLALPIGHKLLDDSSDIALTSLANESFIFVQRQGGHQFYQEFIHSCERQGFTPQVAAEVPRIITAINMVATGAGLTIVPASMQGYLPESVAYRRMTDDRAITAALHLVTHRTAENPAARSFGETVRNFVAGKL